MAAPSVMHSAESEHHAQVSSTGHRSGTQPYEAWEGLLIGYHQDEAFLCMSCHLPGLTIKRRRGWKVLRCISQCEGNQKRLRELPTILLLHDTPTGQAGQ